MRLPAFCLLVAASTACSHDDAKPNPVAATSASPPASAAPASARAPEKTAPSAGPMAEGAHDYRGTLGQKTKIAAHLVRSGAAISGSYVYVGVGASIPLVGTIDDGGTLLLTESNAGKTTGFVTLHFTNGELDGSWTTVKKDKTFPLHLSLGPAWVTPGADAGTPDQRAEACLADPTCAAAEADRLFVAADDAHAPTLDCFRFLDGAGTAKNPGRARGCFERSVGTDTCAGGSPDIDRAELALMLIDGAGGKADLPKARALFEGCFDDVTVSGILAHADKKEHDPKTAPLSFCKDIGGTTLVANACQAHAVTAEETRVALAAKTVVAELDEPARRLFGQAQKAYVAYVSAASGYVYEVFIDGTIRNAMSEAKEQELYKLRSKQLEAFKQFAPGALSSLDVARAEGKAAAATKAVTFDKPADKTAFDKASTAWMAYHDAEIRFYVAALAPKYPADKVERAVRVQLAETRAREAKAPSMEGH